LGSTFFATASLSARLDTIVVLVSIRDEPLKAELHAWVLHWREEEVEKKALMLSGKTSKTAISLIKIVIGDSPSEN
jgi:hypothetical protein